MFGWWAAFFFIGKAVPSQTAAVGWGFAAALLPLIHDAARPVRREPLRRRLLLRAALTAATGLVFYQHAAVTPADPAPERPGRYAVTASESRAAPVAALRSHVRSVCSSRRLTGRSRGMLLALLLADRSSLEPATRDRWRSLGIAHFLALSGLHLGIVALPVYRLISLFRLRGVVRESAAFLVLSLYAAAAGAPLSLLRAASLLLVVRVHLLAGRRVYRDEALLTGAFIVCLFVPRSLTDPGFMLSVCAAGGVLLVGVPLGRMVRGSGRGRARRAAGYLAAALCVAVSAALFTIPLTTRLFGTAPLSGPPLSILLAPLVTALLYAGFAYVAAGHLLGSVGAAPVNLLATAVTVLPERVPARLSAALIRGDLNEHFFAAGAALLACSLARGRPKPRLAAAGVVVIAASFLVVPDMNRESRHAGCDTLAMGVVMTGCGGTIVIEGPLHERRAVSISRRLIERGIRNVDRAIVTHGGCVSLRGLTALDERVRLRRVIVSPWLLECPEARGQPIRRRLEALSGVLRIDHGPTRLSVSGPRFGPGNTGVFAGDDSDLRIYPLDSDVR